MNLPKITYIFIAGVTIMIVVGMIVLLLISPRMSNVEYRPPAGEAGISNIETSPTPYISNSLQKITPQMPKIVLSNVEKTKLVAKLPYTGEGFVVEYYPQAGLFYVRMNTPGTDTPEYTTAVNWLKSTGVTNPEKTADIQFTFPSIKR